jgi:hypothetical protein
LPWKFGGRITELGEHSFDHIREGRISQDGLEGSLSLSPHA